MTDNDNPSRSFTERVSEEGLTINEQFDAYGKAALPVLECDICGERCASIEGKSEVMCIAGSCGGMAVVTGEYTVFEV